MNEYNEYTVEEEKKPILKTLKFKDYLYWNKK
mgnify:CR=1 FL=1